MLLRRSRLVENGRHSMPADAPYSQWPAWARPLIEQYRIPTITVSRICVPDAVYDYIVGRMKREADQTAREDKSNG